MRKDTGSSGTSGELLSSAVLANTSAMVRARLQQLAAACRPVRTISKDNSDLDVTP